MLPFQPHHIFCDTLLCYLTCPSHFHPDLHSPTSVLTERGFSWGYWSHLAQHMTPVTQLNIWQYLRESGHQAATRALPFLLSASPEVKVPVLHLNYSFLSKRSPTPLTNAAPLSTPWLDLLALSSGIGWRRWDTSCLHAQALWKSGCYSTPKQFKLDNTVNWGWDWWKSIVLFHTTKFRTSSKLLKQN